MAKLFLKNMVKIYRGRKVVNSISLEVRSGDVVGLLGPNGAGKTTTFYMAVGMIQPDEGHVFLDGEDITDYPMYLRARKGVGYLPQKNSVFGKLSVKQNMMLILEVMGMTRQEREEKSKNLLEELGIDHLAGQRAGVLSGGEMRRLEISRALATNPAFILLDEPFAGVDPLAVTDIRNIIFHLKNRNIGILISDHSVRETLGACDNAYILEDGKMIEYGSPEKIASSPTARKAYLGEDFRL